MTAIGSELKISRDQAAKITADAIRFSGHYDGMVVYRVASLDELSRPPMMPYLPSAEPLEDCWIVYLLPKQETGLCSSTVAWVSKSTGRVISVGSAGDEG